MDFAKLCSQPLLHKENSTASVFTHACTHIASHAVQRLPRASTFTWGATAHHVRPVRRFGK